MEHLARVRNEDPLEFRLKNMNPMYEGSLKDIIDQLRRSSDYDKRARQVYYYIFKYFEWLL